MRSSNLLKALLLVCSSFLWLSCSSSEEVVTPDEFKPLKIISISPDSASVGDEIVITGENFIENKDFDQVWFGGNIRGEVDSATTTKLFLKVPEGAQTGAISISNGIYADTLKSSFKIVVDPDAPNNIEFTPIQGYENGVIVFVNGNNFGNKVTVTMSGGVTFESNVYNNQISFILPKGVETGRICIKNDKGRTGCSDKEFIVLKGFSGVSAELNGIKLIRTRKYTSGNGGGQSITSVVDTINKNEKYNSSRCSVRSKDYYNSIGLCYFFYPEIPPYSDTVMQCTEFTNQPLNYNHYGASYVIDSTQKIVKNLRLTKTSYTRLFEDKWEGHDCKKLEITFRDVPYSIVNGKITIQLNSSQISEYLLNYLDQTEEGGHSTTDSHFNRTESLSNKIYEILPDAFFELTLE